MANSTKVSERLRVLLTDLEQCEHAGDRVLLRETLRLLRDDLRTREAEQQHADARYRLAVEAAGLGVWDWGGREGQVLSAVAAARLRG